MAAKQSNMEFLVDFMKKNPNAAYADAAAAAKKAKKQIFPIMWGRAQVMLGRASAKKRGTKKKMTSAAPAKVGKRRGRPPGSKNKTRAAAPASRNGASVALPVSNPSELGAWQDLVNNLNAGGKVALQFDGSSWFLVSI